MILCPPRAGQLPAAAADGRKARRRSHPGRRAGHWLRSSDSAPASFLRFVLIGGGSNLVYLAGFWALSPTIGTQAANAFGSLTSTVIANELHRRRTFHVSATIRWYTAQWEGGGLALAGLAATSLALAAADRWLESPSPAIQSLILITVTGVVGLLRFLLLRRWFRG